MCTFIDLFAGIGGTRLGFEAAGGTCTFSSEYDRYAAHTYAVNHGEVPAGDITQLRLDDIPEHDVLVAGFPCQPFSIAGVSKLGALGRPDGFKHPDQGHLFFSTRDVLAYRRPRAFLLENVKHLRNHDRGRTYRTIRETLSSLKYHVDDRVIDARTVVPQHRERIYIVGFRCSDDFARFNFPDMEDRNPALTNILDPKVDSKYTLSDHLWKYLQEYAEKHRARGNGFGFGLPDLNGVSRTLSARYYKDGSEILIRQKAGLNPRRLTPRECLRLMGFPESFKIPVSDTRAYQQFGNSVVVPVVEAIARKMVEAMGIKPPDAPGNYLRRWMPTGESELDLPTSSRNRVHAQAR
ncbi:MAG: DNA (cytosine-5-)-methyltransferase [Chloroflexi bacterium]|nr:DNA (cytosine-5-)-methyltransferase [Chloroflexota bacterium]